MIKTDMEILHELRLMKKYKRDLYVEELLNNAFITLRYCENNSIKFIHVRIKDIVGLEDVRPNCCRIVNPTHTKSLTVQHTSKEILEMIDDVRRRIVDTALEQDISDMNKLTEEYNRDYGVDFDKMPFDELPPVSL